VKVTYLIGNGLDIHIGLKTSYQDFYSFLQKNKNEPRGTTQNQIYNNILNNHFKIEKQPDDIDWSDFEIAIGQYTNQIDNEVSLEMFINDYEEFIEEFTDFIENQSKGVTSTSFINNTHKIFNNALQKPINLEERDQINIHSNFKNNNKDQQVRNFIVFNYTEVFDEIYHSWREKAKQTRIVSSIPIHIHGLCQSQVLLGVNDESQLQGKFCENDTLKIMMVKTLANRSALSMRFEKATEVVKNSELFIIFGMSLGDSDKYWWEKIMENLEKNSANKVLIYAYVNERGKLEKYIHRMVEKKRYWQDKLVKHSKAEDKNQLYNQIFIQFDTEQIFNFDKTILEENNSSAIVL